MKFTGEVDNEDHCSAYWTAVCLTPAFALIPAELAEIFADSPAVNLRQRSECRVRARWKTPRSVRWPAITLQAWQAMTEALDQNRPDLLDGQLLPARRTTN